MKNLVVVSMIAAALGVSPVVFADRTSQGHTATSKADTKKKVSYKKKKAVKRRGSGRLFVFSPRKHKWYAYKNGRLVKSGRASGGKSYCRDIKRSCLTPRGNFRVIRKGSASCRSGTYPKPRGGARMDYCMFFSKYYAIHGSNSVPNYNASHGCIRVKPHAARWLNKNFLRIGDRVRVTSY